MSFLSILVRTTGQETLYYTLLSAKDQMRPMDEIIVSAVHSDTPALAQGRKIFLNTFGIRQNASYLEVPQGIDPYHYATRRAEGVWLVYMEDTSLLTAGALDVIRDAAQQEEKHEKPHPLMFGVRHSDGITTYNAFVPYNQRFSKVESVGVPVKHDFVIQWMQPYCRVTQR